MLGPGHRSSEAEWGGAGRGGLPGGERLGTGGLLGVACWVKPRIKKSEIQSLVFRRVRVEVWLLCWAASEGMCGRVRW